MSENPVWYLADPDGNEPLGPFTTADIQEKIRNQTVRLDDFIWAEHFPEGEWKRIFEVKEFQREAPKAPRLPTPKKRSKGIVSALQNQGDPTIKRRQIIGGHKNAFRRFPRVNFHSDVFIHNDQDWIRAESLDISERGIFVSVDQTDFLKKGEEVVVTIVQGGNLTGISIRAAVMRITEKDQKTGYGLIFLRMNPSVRMKIAKLVIEKLNEGQYDGASPTGEPAAS